MKLFSARSLTNRVYLPWVPIPAGRMVELPGRGGATYVTDTPGPSPDSPTVVLLHALGCTGLLTWYPCIEPLSRPGICGCFGIDGRVRFSVIR